MNITQQDILQLDRLYEGRKPYYGELHDHTNSGVRGDGHNSLTEWKAELKKLKMDFATLVDHRQVMHMLLPEWDDTVFIGGTEPGTVIRDSKAEEPSMHYNMIFYEAAQLEALLAEFPEYKFNEVRENEFVYSRFDTDRFQELIRWILEHDGFFVHPHPKQLMRSDDPLDYWFMDGTGLEVFYTYHEEQGGEKTQANYKLWTDLLALGKRVFATAGNDEHRLPTTKALTTIFSPEKHSRAYVHQLRKGDFVCGGVGVRMCVGDTAMGGITDFAGKRLTLSVGDFHESLQFADHSYRLELLDDTGIVLSEPIDPTHTAYLAIDPDPGRKFYRAEVWDLTRNIRIALGNPIWNETEEETK